MWWLTQIDLSEDCGEQPTNASEKKSEKNVNVAIPRKKGTNWSYLASNKGTDPHHEIRSFKKKIGKKRDLYLRWEAVSCHYEN